MNGIVGQVAELGLAILVILTAQISPDFGVPFGNYIATAVGLFGLLFLPLPYVETRQVFTTPKSPEDVFADIRDDRSPFVQRWRAKGFEIVDSDERSIQIQKQSVLQTVTLTLETLDVDEDAGKVRTVLSNDSGANRRIELTVNETGNDTEVVQHTLTTGRMRLGAAIAAADRGTTDVGDDAYTLDTSTRSYHLRFPAALSDQFNTETV